MSEKIRLENVNFIYGAGTPYETRALKDVSFSLEAGSMTGLIGHTGSGKTTLVRLLNGLERPASGRVLLDGADIWEKPREIGRIRFRVGIVMQYPEYQLFEETVGKDIAFGPKNMKLPADEIERRVFESARTVGLSEDDLGKSPFDLSGGQKRRVAIAGVMAMDPEVLILDEPAAGLDPEGREIVFSSIEKYRREKNATVLIVSHSMEDVAERCGGLLILGHGQLIKSGSVDEVFGNPEELKAAGLDVPQLTYLGLLLERRGIKLDRSVYTLGNTADAVASLLSGTDMRRGKTL